MDKFFLVAIVLALPTLPRHQLNSAHLDFTISLAQDQSDDSQDIPRSDEEGSDEEDSDEGAILAFAQDELSRNSVEAEGKRAKGANSLA
jgi:hypothetical protein